MSVEVFKDVIDSLYHRDEPSTAYIPVRASRWVEFLLRVTQKLKVDRRGLFPTYLFHYSVDSDTVREYISEFPRGLFENEQITSSDVRELIRKLIKTGRSSRKDLCILHEFFDSIQNNNAFVGGEVLIPREERLNIDPIYVTTEIGFVDGDSLLHFVESHYSLGYPNLSVSLVSFGPLIQTDKYLTMKDVLASRSLDSYAEAVSEYLNSVPFLRKTFIASLMRVDPERYFDVKAILSL